MLQLSRCLGLVAGSWDCREKGSYQDSNKTFKVVIRISEREASQLNVSVRKSFFLKVVFGWFLSLFTLFTQFLSFPNLCLTHLYEPIRKVEQTKVHIRMLLFLTSGRKNTIVEAGCRYKLFFSIIVNNLLVIRFF